MKTLVTGAAGYIGSVTTEVLLTAGHEVIALDSLELGHRAAVHEDATFVQADLRDRQAVMDVFAAHRARCRPPFRRLCARRREHGAAGTVFL